MYKVAVPGVCVVLACFTLLTVSSCSPRTTPARNERPASRERNISLLNMNADIINLVNEIRATKHLPPLKVLYAASIEAARHSQDMAAKRVPFGHDGFKERAIVLANELKGSSATGENVAYGKMTAKEVITAWLQSPAHRANIEGNFTYTGVGVAKDNRGVIYYTELFVKK